MLVSNGRIWTGNPHQPWASAMLIEGSTIKWVGESQETPDIDLDGRLCLPGLWDAHIHLYYWCMNQARIRLTGSENRDDMLHRIATADSKSEWLIGWGWNETLWDDRRLPSLAELDEVTGDRPALFERSDLHSAVVNTEALKRAGLLNGDTEVAGGVVELGPHGKPTGVLRELAINVVKNIIPQPCQGELDEALLNGQSQLHKMGVTAVCDQRVKGQLDGPLMWSALSRLQSSNQLRIRVNCNLAAHELQDHWTHNLNAGPYLQPGHVKLFSDGTLGSRTALMLEPFLGEPANNRGLMLSTPEELRRDARAAAERGFPVSIHAIGDAANRLCLDIFQELGPVGSVPHRLEHAQFLTSEDVRRFSEVPVTASMQPVHLLDDRETADAYLGARCRRAFRWGSLLREGALLAFGSDAPVADPSPFLGIQASVHRGVTGSKSWYPEECISLADTLRAYTIGAARAAGWENRVGTLEPGKEADFCILSSDIFSEQSSVERTQVEMTVVGGEVVYST